MLKLLKIVVTYHAGYFGWLVGGVLAGWCVTASRTTEITRVICNNNFLIILT
jgi:hypothetical protein